MSDIDFGKKVRKSLGIPDKLEECTLNSIRKEKLKVYDMLCPLYSLMILEKLFGMKESQAGTEAV